MKLILRLAIVAALTVSITDAFSQTNKKLIAQLDTILKDDQRYRRIKNASPQQDKENMRMQHTLDLANLAKVEKLIDQYGYPGKSMVGVKHQSTVFLVIQHNDTEAQDKYLPLLTKAAGKGELRASSLAILIDRVKTGHGQPQIYGSQTHETKDGVKLYPIEDEWQVNTRRAKIGLGPIEPYLAQWHIKYKVPTKEHNPNPASIYYDEKKREVIAIEAVGGDTGIFERLQYPARAKEAGIKGSVLVEFTVGADGNTKNIIVVNGLGYGCDEEAIRVIKETKYNNKAGEDADMRMKLPFPYKG
ncbi:energy transducer TonB [Mucilaginibacter pallidiroseus]|uniref:Energy transducer TonB n=1 Tax=Mucilaginibacter pallidiroseus TaxID=2599295 RepID=A0A563U575_9SPHI|nr:energy transducer TonB [Mucilaginibacter pallidiroseus]TWR26506.1 energy transducer TonB [Mucilaginibacter pallidiroseus]